MLFLPDGDHSMGDITTDGMFFNPGLACRVNGTRENRHLPCKKRLAE
jgi:hypothetical protein